MPARQATRPNACACRSALGAARLVLVGGPGAWLQCRLAPRTWLRRPRAATVRQFGAKLAAAPTAAQKPAAPATGARGKAGRKTSLTAIPDGGKAVPVQPPAPLVPTSADEQAFFARMDAILAPLYAYTPSEADLGRRARGHPGRQRAKCRARAGDRGAHPGSGRAQTRALVPAAQRRVGAVACRNRGVPPRQSGFSRAERPAVAGRGSAADQGRRSQGDQGAL